MNRLQDRRLELGLTQPQVSEMLKEVDPRMDVGMVSRFERGACLPTPKVLAALETALQASRTELYGGEDLLFVRELEEAMGGVAAEEWPEGVQRIAGAIPFGWANAVTREHLSRELLLTDRKVRELIEQARRYGCIIINAQDGRGYYQSDDPNDWEKQYRQDTNRALSVLSRRKYLRQRLRAVGRDVK